MQTRILFSRQLYDFLLRYDYAHLYFWGIENEGATACRQGVANYILQARKRPEIPDYEANIISLEHMTNREINDMLSMVPSIQFWVELPSHLSARFSEMVFGHYFLPGKN